MYPGSNHHSHNNHSHCADMTSHIGIALRQARSIILIYKIGVALGPLGLRGCS